MTNSTQKPLKRSVIKEELVAITGDYVKAIILNQFIYWSERVNDFDRFIAEEKRRMNDDGLELNMQPTNGWIYKCANELIDETMLGISAATLGRHIQVLVDKGYLLWRNNPEHHWDRTKQYRVDFVKTRGDLGKMGYSLEGYAFFNLQDAFFTMKDASFEMKNGNSNLKNQTIENERAIPEITTEITYREKNNNDNNSKTCVQILDNTKISNQLSERTPSRTNRPTFTKHEFMGESKNEFAWEEPPMDSPVPNNPFPSPSEFEIAATKVKTPDLEGERQAGSDKDPYIQVDNRMSQHLGRIYIAKQDDYRAIKQLLESQVPLDFILAGIDFTFANFGDRKIYGFGYCAKVIIQQWALEKAKHEDVRPIDWHEALESEGNFRRSDSSKAQLPVTERHDKYEAFYNLLPG